MPKKFGDGELISAGQLEEGDLYKENTRAKLRIEVFSVTAVDDEYITLLSKQVGQKTYPVDRPLILVQRAGLPVPNPDPVD